MDDAVENDGRLPLGGGALLHRPETTMNNAIDFWLFPLLHAASVNESWRTALGIFSAEWLIWVFPIWAAVMVWRNRNRDRRAVLFAALACTLSLAFSHLIGLLWPRSRPFVLGFSTLVAHASSPSFPSSHATLAYTAALTVAVIRNRIDLLFVLSVALATVIALARVFVGVHYPTDVIGGFFLAGLTSLCIGYAARRPVKGTGHRQRESTGAPTSG